jgi:hypothetical protein
MLVLVGCEVGQICARTATLIVAWMGFRGSSLKPAIVDDTYIELQAFLYRVPEIDRLVAARLPYFSLPCPIHESARCIDAYSDPHDIMNVPPIFLFLTTHTAWAWLMVV